MDRISVDPAIRFGKPCIAGTRITVQDVYAVTARLLEGQGHDIALAGRLGLAQAEAARFLGQVGGFVADVAQVLKRRGRHTPPR